MDNKSDEQFIVMQATIESNKQDMKYNKQEYDDKKMKFTEDFKAMLASSITSIKYQINTLNSSPTQKDSPNTPEPTTAVPDNIRDPPLYGLQSMKIGGVWTLKHDIISLKLYELLIKT